jgi:hypothetical protein
VVVADIGRGLRARPSSGRRVTALACRLAHGLLSVDLTAPVRGSTSVEWLSILRASVSPQAAGGPAAAPAVPFW